MARRRKTLLPLFDTPTQEEVEAEKQRVAAERARRAAERAHRHTSHGVRRRSFTIDEFCFANGFSRATYYNLKADGEAPDEMRVRGKIIITDETDAKWRKKRAAAKVAPRARAAARLTSTTEARSCE